MATEVVEEAANCMYRSFKTDLFVNWRLPGSVLQNEDILYRLIGKSGESYFFNDFINN